MHVLSVKKGGYPTVELMDDLAKKVDEGPCPKCLAINIFLVFLFTKVVRIGEEGGWGGAFLTVKST